MTSYLCELSRLCRDHRLHLAPCADGVKAWPDGATWFVVGADHLDAARKVEERLNIL